MLGESSVQRISVGAHMEDWWESELARTRAEALSRGNAESAQERNSEHDRISGSGDVTRRGGGENEGDQWGGTLPGHGGT